MLLFKNYVTAFFRKEEDGRNQMSSRCFKKNLVQHEGVHSEINLNVNT